MKAAPVKKSPRFDSQPDIILEPFKIRKNFINFPVRKRHDKATIQPSKRPTPKIRAAVPNDNQPK
jgi:hypothetical protein